jgi:hypothetical protein
MDCRCSFKAFEVIFIPKQIFKKNLNGEHHSGKSGNQITGKTRKIIIHGIRKDT